MERKYMERLIGKYCKIVTKEPGEERASVVTGRLEDVDYKDGFILINSNQGLGCLRINTVIAIKPAKNKVDTKKHKIKYEENAVVGIGTLIIFVAMVLVAAVAASVIIQTSETLQQRAQAVGKQTIRDVSSGMKIIDLTGYTDETRTKIEYLAITVKPRAGSYDIDLTETLLYIQYDNLTVLTHDNQTDLNMDGAHEDGIFHTLNMSNLTSTNYGVVAIHDSDDSITDNFGMSTSDTAMLIVNLSASFSDTEGLTPGEEFLGRLVPEIGAAGTFIVTAPTVFEHRVVEL